MTPEEYELLGRIDQKIDGLTKSFTDFKEVATSETGFTRCAVHKANVENAINTMAEAKKNLQWFKRVSIGGFSTIIAGLGLERFFQWLLKG